MASVFLVPWLTREANGQNNSHCDFLLVADGECDDECLSPAFDYDGGKLSKGFDQIHLWTVLVCRRLLCEKHDRKW